MSLRPSQRTLSDEHAHPQNIKSHQQRQEALLRKKMKQVLRDERLGMKVDSHVARHVEAGEPMILPGSPKDQRSISSMSCDNPPHSERKLDHPSKDSGTLPRKRSVPSTIAERLEEVIDRSRLYEGTSFVLSRLLENCNKTSQQFVKISKQDVKLVNRFFQLCVEPEYAMLKQHSNVAMVSDAYGADVKQYLMQEFSEPVNENCTVQLKEGEFTTLTSSSNNKPPPTDNPHPDASASDRPTLAGSTPSSAFDATSNAPKPNAAMDSTKDSFPENGGGGGNLGSPNSLFPSKINKELRLHRSKANLVRANSILVQSNSRQHLLNKREQSLQRRCRSESPQKHGEKGRPGFHPRRQSSTTGIDFLPDELDSLLHNLDEWDFDIFKVEELSPNGALPFIGFALFERHLLLQVFNINEEVLNQFLHTVRSKYPENPYHNSLHAADVTQCLSHMIVRCGLERYAPNPLSRFAAIFAALVHDINHPGVNNNFLIQTGHDLAILYNDKSPLEMMHTATAFQVLRNPDCNIVSSMLDQEKKVFRSLVMGMILATDNAEHYSLMKDTNKAIARGMCDTSPDVILKIGLHASDICASARPWKTYQKWSKRIITEFRMQGDLERARGMDVLPLFDRESPQPVARFQSGFVQAVVKPLYVCLARVPYMELSHCTDLLDTNLKSLEEQAPNNPTSEANDLRRDSVDDSDCDSRTTAVDVVVGSLSELTMLHEDSGSKLGRSPPKALFVINGEDEEDESELDGDEDVNFFSDSSATSEGALFKMQ